VVWRDKWIDLPCTLPVLRQEQVIGAVEGWRDLLEGLLERVMLGGDDHQVISIRRGNLLDAAHGIILNRPARMALSAIDHIQGQPIGKAGRPARV